MNIFNQWGPSKNYLKRSHCPCDKAQEINVTIPSNWESNRVLDLFQADWNERVTKFKTNSSRLC